MPGAAPIAILGGTFDPPHNGHLLLAECARVQFGAGHVLFQPAGEPYRKAGTRPGGGNPSPAGHRLEMTRLAIAGNDAFLLDDREVRRAGPTYTVDTLREMRLELGSKGPEFLLILGTDAIADMPNWKEPEQIAHLARIVVAEKADAEVDHSFERVHMPRFPLSSTMIRNRVAAGEPIRYLVPEAVHDYIRSRRLYTGPA